MHTFVANALNNIPHGEHELKKNNVKILNEHPIAYNSNNTFDIRNDTKAIPSPVQQTPGIASKSL